MKSRWAGRPKREATIQKGRDKRDRPRGNEIHFGPDPGAAPARADQAEDKRGRVHALEERRALLSWDAAPRVYLSSVSSRLVCPQLQNSI